MDDTLTGNGLARMASQCVAETELVYTEHREQNVHKTMLLVAMPACCESAAGEHSSKMTKPAPCPKIPIHATEQPSLRFDTRQIKGTFHYIVPVSPCNSCSEGPT